MGSRSAPAGSGRQPTAASPRAPLLPVPSLRLLMVVVLLLLLLLPLLLPSAGCLTVSRPGATQPAAAGIAASRHPRMAETWLREGAVLEEQGLDAQAVALYAGKLGEVEDGPVLLRGAVAAAERLDDPHQAASWLELLHRGQPADLELELRLAVLLARAGRAEEARRRLQELAGSGRCPLGRCVLAAAWVELHAGKPMLARALAQLARERDTPGTAALLGLVQARLGRLDEARLLLRQALAEEPERWELRLLLGEVLLLGGKTEEAEAELEAVLRLRPRQPRALLWAGLASSLRQDAVRARELFAQAVQAGEPAAHLPLAELSTAEGGPQAATAARAHLDAYRQAFERQDARPPGSTAQEGAGKE